MASERSETAQTLHHFVKEGGWPWTSRLGVLILPPLFAEKDRMRG